MYFLVLLNSNSPNINSTIPTGRSTYGSQPYMGTLEPNWISALTPLEPSAFMMTNIPILSPSLFGVQYSVVESDVVTVSR